MLRQQLDGMQRRAEVQRREDVLDLQEQCSHVQGAYERLLSEKEEVESKLVRSEEESRRMAEVRVRGMEARISKMEHAVQNRGVKAEDTIAELRETLEVETARRLELEERNEKFGEVLLSVLDMNQEIARHYPAPETKSQGTTTSRSNRSAYAAASRMTPKPRSTWTSNSNSGGTLPFLPASHHRTYNLLATLSLAVRECKQREPKQVLDVLYELVQQESGSVMGREERRTFSLSGESVGSASTSLPSTTQARGRHVSLARGRRRTAAAEYEEEKQRKQQQEQQQQQQQQQAEEHDEEVILAVQAELKELESLLEDELQGLNRKYAGGRAQASAPGFALEARALPVTASPLSPPAPTEATAAATQAAAAAAAAAAAGAVHKPAGKGRGTTCPRAYVASKWYQGCVRPSRSG
eukprot:evm.model.NODE_20345_length_5958_cov_21.502350.1